MLKQIYIVGFISTFSTFCSLGLSGTERPNILFILTDDQGYGDLGAYGNTYIETPEMDRLWEESSRFTDFIVSPVCSPSRASLMTGRYNQRTGIWDTYGGRARMASDEVTLAEVMREDGYRTGLFGKWHLGNNYPLRPMDQGFETAFGWRGTIGTRRINPTLYLDDEPGDYEGFMTDIIFDKCMEWIEARAESEEPFFAYMATYLPHDAHGGVVPQKYLDRYAEVDLPEFTKEVYAMLDNLDMNVGRLLAKLEELGIADNTIVIFTSDNGPQQASSRFEERSDRYNLGMRRGKGTVYEGGIRLPCFFRWPGRFEAGRDIDRMAAHIDILPTVLELCGISVPEQVSIDGTSLAPTLLGEASSLPPRMLFGQLHRAEIPDKWTGGFARTERYKFVAPDEFYDLREDRAESRNVASEHPELFLAYKAAYGQWFDSVSQDRGFVPSSVSVGSPYQAHVKLGWTKRHSTGWPLLVESEGPYRITVSDVEPDLFPEGGDLYLKFGDKILQAPIRSGETEIVIEEALLPVGEYSLNPWTEGKKLPRKEERWMRFYGDYGYRDVTIELLAR